MLIVCDVLEPAPEGIGTDARCPGGGAIYNYSYAGTHLLGDLFGVFVT